MRSLIRQRGFGLIELLVSISIMVLVTTIVLAGHSSFNGSVLLRSQAYEIALRLREVQLAAVGVSGAGVNDFRSLAGAQFSQGNNKYLIFSTPDTNPSWLGNVTQAGPMGVLDKRFVISDISALGSGTSYNGTIQIVFNRPNFDAKFFHNGIPLASSEHTLVISIGPQGAIGGSRSVINEKKITVTRSGQISVE